MLLLQNPNLRRPGIFFYTRKPGASGSAQPDRPAQPSTSQFGTSGTPGSALPPPQTGKAGTP